MIARSTVSLAPMRLITSLVAAHNVVSFVSVRFLESRDEFALSLLEGGLRQ
jgi:hypothetical protein